MALQSINPATEETLAEYRLLEPGQAGALLQEAYDTAARWRATTYPERASSPTGGCTGAATGSWFESTVGLAAGAGPVRGRLVP